MPAPAAQRPETVAAVERLAPLCEEFAAALRVDLGYVLELAREGAKQRARLERSEAA